MALQNNGQPCKAPAPKILGGKLVQLTHFNYEHHTDALWNGLGGDETKKLKRFFQKVPYQTKEDFGTWIKEVNERKTFHTMVISSNKTQEIIGMASYMRWAPEDGTVEIGFIAHGPKMRRSPQGSEAHYLLAKHIFEDLVYRRYEWKLNNENEASHKAAQRLGFSLEGVFSQQMGVNGKNRDIACYSMLDSEWPLKRDAFKTWLDPANFDKAGGQLKSLSQIRNELSD